MIYAVCAITVILLSLILQLSYGYRGKLANTIKLIGTVSFIMSFIITFLLSALRYQVGVDYNSYIEWFSLMLKDDYTYFEPAFTALIDFIQLFTSEGHWLVVASSFVSLVLVFYVVKKVSPYPAISMVIFFGSGLLFHSFNLIRQFIAASIILFAFMILLKNKKVAYWLAVLTSFLFHKTALVTAPLILLTKRLSLRTWFFITGVSIALMVAGSRLEGFLISSFYPQHSDNEFVIDFGVSPIYILTGVVLVLVACIAIRSRDVKNEDRAIILSSNTLIITGIFHIFYWWIPLYNRIGLYFDIVTVIALPIIIRSISNTNNRSVVVFAIAAYYVSLFTLTLLSSGADITSYKSILGSN